MWNFVRATRSQDLFTDCLSSGRIFVKWITEETFKVSCLEESANKSDKWVFLLLLLFDHCIGWLETLKLITIIRIPNVFYSLFSGQYSFPNTQKKNNTLTWTHTFLWHPTRECFVWAIFLLRKFYRVSYKMNYIWDYCGKRTWNIYIIIKLRSW